MVVQANQRGNAMTEVSCIWDAKAVLGEGPVWASDQSSLYWVDIKQKLVHRLQTLTGAQRTWAIPEQVSSIAQRVNGRWVATVRDGFVELDLTHGGAVTPIVLPEAGMPKNRFNDGKVDANGRYWAGSMDDDETAASGSLYCLNAQQECRVMDRGYCITNGPTFSVDSKILYHTDTVARKIFSFDVASDGSLSGKRPFYTVPESDGFPDGMTVDAENCLWLCHFFGGKISRLSPDGKVIGTLCLPVSNVTSCTFGGPKLEQLFITTARWALSAAQLKAQPLAGGLFVCEPGVAGLPAGIYQG